MLIGSFFNKLFDILFELVANSSLLAISHFKERNKAESERRAFSQTKTKQDVMEEDLIY